jgi:hypothetical protein
VAKAKQDDPKQVAAFRKAARELGLDESEERFQATLRTIAKAKPLPEKGKWKDKAES